MGAIWRSYDKDLAEPVAVKLLRTDVEQTSARFRFGREIRALARLDHPGIVGIRDYGEDHRGSPFYVMDLLDGRALAGYRRESFPLPLMLHLVEEVLAALAYAHARGVIHRDLKPENIILTRDAVRKFHATLVDFGIASVVKEGSSLGTPMASMLGKFVVGTPEYMAPEQVEAKAHEISPACDLYAIGVILYEYICGKVPFSAGTALATATLQLTQAVPPIEPTQPDYMPPGLETLVYRLLAKDPWDRPRFAAEVRAELAELRRTSEQLRSRARGEDLFISHSSTELDALPRNTRSRQGDHQTVLSASGSLAAEADDGMPSGGYNEGMDLHKLREVPLVGFGPVRSDLLRRLTEVHDTAVGQIVLLEGPIADTSAPQIPRWLRRQADESAAAISLVAHFDSGGTGLVGPSEQLLRCRGLNQRGVEQQVTRFLARHGEDDGYEMGMVSSFLRPSGAVVTGMGMLTPVARHSVFDRLLRRAATERPVLLCLEGITQDTLAEVVAPLAHIANGMAARPYPLLVIAYCECGTTLCHDGQAHPEVASLLESPTVQLLDLREAPQERRSGPLAADSQELPVHHTGPLAQSLDVGTASDWSNESDFELFDDDLIFEDDEDDELDSADTNQILVVPPELPPIPATAEKASSKPAKLGAEDRHRVLACAAVIGQPFFYRAFELLLGAIGGTAVMRPDQVWQTMIKEGVWRELPGDRGTFTDRRLRRRVLTQLEEHEEAFARIHRVSADVKRRLWEQNALHHAEMEIAEHLVAAGDSMEAVVLLIDSAQLATARGDDDRARKLLEFAARLAGTIEHAHGVRASIAYAFAIIDLRAGQLLRAGQRFGTARAEYQENGEQAGAALALAGLAQIAAIETRHEAAAEIFGEAAFELETCDEPSSEYRLDAARTRIGEASAYCRVGRWTSARDALELAFSTMSWLTDNDDEATAQPSYMTLFATALTLMAAVQLELGNTDRFVEHATHALHRSQPSSALSAMLARAFRTLDQSAARNDDVPISLDEAIRTRAEEMEQVLGI